METILNKNTEGYGYKYTDIAEIHRYLEENNITNNKITTSLIPNTTLDFIKIKLNVNLTIIDSPGFTLNQTLYNDNDFELIERINPKSFLKPITHQTKEITSIIIENNYVHGTYLIARMENGIFRDLTEEDIKYLEGCHNQIVMLKQAYFSKKNKNA